MTDQNHRIMTCHHYHLIKDKKKKGYYYINLMVDNWIKYLALMKNKTVYVCIICFIGHTFWSALP
ncbi:MAG: hypothetical protein ACKPKO_28180, partial [Candidatus Fonsibacter sp.]